MEEQVVLVNEKNEPQGLMNKMEAHKKGLLHRAFSVFIFNDRDELMIQQRAKDKYHSPLLWTNTCCSHPRNGEHIIDAGKRRLKEEMGFSTELEKVTSFTYKAHFDNGLIEHEFDYILKGFYSENPIVNPDEVESWKWINLENLKKDIIINSDNYTAWFKIILKNTILI